MTKEEAQSYLYDRLWTGYGYKRIYGITDGRFVRLFVSDGDEIEGITKVVAVTDMNALDRKGCWWIRTNTTGCKIDHLVKVLSTSLKQYYEVCVARSPYEGDNDGREITHTTLNGYPLD